MDPIQVYAFERGDGTSFGDYTTQDPGTARTHAEMHGLRVIVHIFECTRSEPVPQWDYTETDDTDDDTAGDRADDRADDTATNPLVASLRKLDKPTRERLARTLEEVKVAEIHRAIVADVRTMAAALYPDRPVRGVVFRYTNGDVDRWCLSDTNGDVLFEDGGSEENASFEDACCPDLFDLLLYLSEPLGGSPTFAVDLREGTVSDGYMHYGIHTLFGEPEPE